MKETIRLKSRYGLRPLLSVLCLLSMISSVYAQGTLPSLDHSPGETPDRLTPVQDFSTHPPQDTSLQPVSNTMTIQTPSPESATQHGKKGWRNLFQDGSSTQPVSYNPLPGIVVFPVIKHGHEKAFGDLPLIFAREYAQRLELKVPDTKVYHPVYTVDELRMQGLGHVYDQIMDYYLKAGRPEPMAMDYLLKQISNNNKTISRVVFVEADLDTSHPAQSTSAIEWIQQMMTDGTPKQMRYFVRSHLQIFDAEKPEMPMVWSGSWNRTVKTNQFFNVTPSVFADSDSQQAFADVSRRMSREILFVTPKAAYLDPVYDTSVAGQLVSGQQKGMPDFSEGRHNAGRLTLEDRETIRKILHRQGPGSR